VTSQLGTGKSLTFFTVWRVFVNRYSLHQNLYKYTYVFFSTVQFFIILWPKGTEASDVFSHSIQFRMTKLDFEFFFNNQEGIYC
jgi:hypothetical protein